MSNEKEDLQTLITSPGWLRVVNYATQEWQEQIARHMETAANDTNDLMALQKMRQVIAAKKAVERLIAWPEERLRAMQASTERVMAPPSVSRRGTL